MKLVMEKGNESVLWCRECGVLLCANVHDPISGTDWKIPELVKCTFPVNSTNFHAKR